MESNNKVNPGTPGAGLLSVQYDPAALRQYANKTHRKATRIVAQYTLLWGLAGLVLSLIFVTIGDFRGSEQQTAAIIVIVATCLPGWIGRLVGSSKALNLKLHAQMALCAIKTEEHAAQIAQDTDKYQKTLNGGMPRMQSPQP